MQIQRSQICQQLIRVNGICTDFRVSWGFTFVLSIAQLYCTWWREFSATLWRHTKTRQVLYDYQFFNYIFVLVVLGKLGRRFWTTGSTYSVSEWLSATNYLAVCTFMLIDLDFSEIFFVKRSVGLMFKIPVNWAVDSMMTYVSNLVGTIKIYQQTWLVRFATNSHRDILVEVRNVADAESNLGWLKKIISSLENLRNSVTPLKIEHYMNSLT